MSIIKFMLLILFVMSTLYAVKVVLKENFSEQEVSATEQVLAGPVYWFAWIVSMIFTYFYDKNKKHSY